MGEVLYEWSLISKDSQGFSDIFDVLQNMGPFWKSFVLCGVNFDLSVFDPDTKKSGTRFFELTFGQFKEEDFLFKEIKKCMYNFLVEL